MQSTGNEPTSEGSRGMSSRTSEKRTEERTKARNLLETNRGKGEIQRGKARYGFTRGCRAEKRGQKGTERLALKAKWGVSTNYRKGEEQAQKISINEGLQRGW